MRTWGRIIVIDPVTKDPVIDPKTDAPKLVWVEVETSPEGYNDFVWLTDLIQVLKLNLGESPFYANYGIPAKPAVVQQVIPDFYMFATQAQFAKHFASLTVSRQNVLTGVRQEFEPVYRVNVTLNNGVKIEADVPVPT